MTKYSLFQKLTVVVLLVATIFVTTPVSAADFTSKAALGSISGVGRVELRGLSLQHEGTLFAGDHVAIGEKSGAKVLLRNGQKLVLDQLTALTFNAGGQVKIGNGNAAFSSKLGKLDIVAGPFQIKGDRELAGDVSFVGTNYVGVRVNTGKATVTNLKTRQTYEVAAGHERLFNVVTGGNMTSVAELASTVPDAIPAVPPIPQRPTPPTTTPSGGSQQPKSGGISHSGWIAIFATLGGVAAAIAVLATRGDDETTAPDVTKARTALTAAISTAGSATAANNTIASSANSAITTINASSSPQKTALLAQANAIASQATLTQQQIASLTTTLNSLQSQLAGVTDQAALTALTTQINNTIASLNQQDVILNQNITALNALVTAAAAGGVTLPPVGIPPVQQTPGVASASIPV